MKQGNPRNFSNFSSLFRLVAYYHRAQKEAFACGGSLISGRLVLTAAHCIQNKGSSSQRRPEDAVFFLGKHDLETSIHERDFVTSRASQFILHPDWNYQDTRYDADLAIVVLAGPVSFTKYIKPICLWTGSNSYFDIIGKKGIIVGWGKTEFTAETSPTPKWAAVPVVDDGTCVRSNKEFSRFTSPRTFCAGVRNSGPCSGDSGKRISTLNNEQTFHSWIHRRRLCGKGFEPMVFKRNRVSRSTWSLFVNVRFEELRRVHGRFEVHQLDLWLHSTVRLALKWTVC